MLRAYIRGRKPEIDASGYAASGVICLKTSSVLQDLTKTRSEVT